MLWTAYIFPVCPYIIIAWGAVLWIRSVSFQGTCRSASCTPGKKLRSDNSTCNTAIPIIRGLSYVLDITLAGHIPYKAVDEADWEALAEDFRYVLETKLPGQTQIFFVTFSPSANQYFLQGVTVRGQFKSSAEINRDDFEKHVVTNVLMNDWDVTDRENKTVSFTYVHPNLPNQPVPDLRTQPGLNLIGTCFTLLCAQLSLLLASHRILSGVWCRALGVVVHVSWLSTFCWTSVSSVHMFRTFTRSSFTNNARGTVRFVMKNIALTTVPPLVVVAVVMVVSHVTSNGKSLGYSSTACHLSSNWLVIFALIVPLAIIILVNTVLFVLTVRHVHNIVKMQGKNETEREHKHVRAFLRLSLLTGTTWILSLVAESLELDWLRAVSILTNGGQGVFLLLSYITTQRVIGMLAVKLGCKVKKATITAVLPTTKSVMSDSIRKCSCQHTPVAMVSTVECTKI